MNEFIPKFVGQCLNFLSFFNTSLASKWALNLFSAPLKGRLKAPHPTLEKAKKEVFYYNNIPIQTYHWQGKKDTVLLVHGWESNSGRWKNIIQRLQQEEYNIVALDAPAHGASGSSSFNAILYSKFITVVSKNFKPNFFIGHSVGGMAISFFLKNNNYTFGEKVVFLGVPSGFPGILNNYIKLMGYNTKISEGLELCIQRKFNQPSTYFNTSHFIKHMDSKGLIIHDENDSVIPFSDAIEIQSNFKNSRLVSTKGLGHGLKGKQVIDHIIDFLKD
ncbi:MAG: alpha/beta hydrolase [Flavobacteriaceae bacterium]